MPPPTRVSWFGFVNTWLVQEEDGLTVIDTMMSGGSKRILTAAQKLGQPIRRIALTHSHLDHVGSLEALVGEREARLLAGDKTLDPPEQVAKLKGGYPGAKTKPTRTLVGGDPVG